MKKVFIAIVICGLAYGIWWIKKHADFSVVFQSPPPETEEQYCSERGNIQMRYLPIKCLKYFSSLTPKE